MPKKIAVLVRDRQDEALRMSLGLILLDDVVDVYVMGRKLEITGENTLNFETIREMEMKIYTDCKENADLEFVPTDEIARRLTAYDHVLPY
ncbi:MAG: hypothetical protein Q8K18_02835 [Burkholderiales bacterium]|nr:hypothetical protein [Burkholderiales bacterium]